MNGNGGDWRLGRLAREQFVIGTIGDWADWQKCDWECFGNVGWKVINAERNNPELFSAKAGQTFNMKSFLFRSFSILQKYAAKIQPEGRQTQSRKAIDAIETNTIQKKAHKRTHKKAHKKAQKKGENPPFFLICLQQLSAHDDFRADLHAFKKINHIFVQHANATG